MSPWIGKPQVFIVFGNLVFDRDFVPVEQDRRKFADSGAQAADNNRIDESLMAALGCRLAPSTRLKNGDGLMANVMGAAQRLRNRCRNLWGQLGAI